MTKGKLTYITGGERSGKSSYGQQLVLQKTGSPVYLATARIFDDDFKKRVKRHQSERDNRWCNIEEPVYLSKHKLEGKVVLLDCVTLWLTNIYYDNDKNVDASLEFAKTEWKEFIHQNFELVVISNELGMGVHGITEEVRKFVELQGWMNQYIAKMADEAWLMVSGIPTQLK